VQGGGKAKDDHIYDEIINTCKETLVNKKTPMLIIKTDEALDSTSSAAARDRTHCADVIKCSSHGLSLKPPLLPKPHTSPKVLTSSPKYGSSSTRPLIPKRPNLVSSTGRNGKEPNLHSGKEKPFLKSTTTDGHGKVTIRRLPLHIKAPVAKLEEFESFCDTVKSDNPVRPPRSPKHQPFKGGPFTVFENKPEIPLKMKQWNHHETNAVLGSGEALQLHWQTAKERSASLGRTNAFRFVEAKAKSASLGRDRTTNFAKYLAREEGLSSSETRYVPIPPPRQKKKQCEHSHSIPLYAEVNYNLKKNRRQAAEEQKECSKCVIDVNEEEVQEQVTVIEGKLVLPGPNHDSSVSKVKGVLVEEPKEAEEESSQRSVVCQNFETVKEPNEMEVMKESGVSGENVEVVDKCEYLNSGHLTNGCVISQDQISYTSDLDFIKVDKNDCISRQPFSIDISTSETSSIISPDGKIEVNSHTEESSTSNPLPVPAEENRNESRLKCFSGEAKEDLTPNKIEWQLAKLSICESTVDSAEHNAIEGKSSSQLCHITCARSGKVSETEVTVVTNSESVDGVNNTDISVNNTVDNGEVSCSDLVIVKETEVTSQTDVIVSKNPDSACGECRISASSLPLRRKLEMKELGQPHQRRRSWSSYKDDSPPPEKTPHRIPTTHKRKSKIHSWWCDEGELSSGVLGDLDSSDTTARQSSFEEVDWTGSDVEDEPNPVRSKLCTWLGSFGKGNRKHKTRRDSNSEFYCDSQENSDQKARKGDPDKEQIPVLEVTECPSVEVQVTGVDGFVSTVPDGTRPLSGLSTLSTLDIDQKSDAPVSEESFDTYMHSDSENEVETNLEDRDANNSQSEKIRLEKKAFYIAQELMTSERVFIDVLKLLSMDFRQAVHAVAAEQKYPVIPDAELDKILNSLPQLQSLNEDLLHDLEHRIDNWNSVKKIADVIVRKGPFLKLYTSYIQNFESQCNYLEECCQKYPRFAKVVREFEASSRCQKLSLKHYMLKPVQRIPQYRLLLEDYLHHLSPSSPDLDDTRTALKIVCDVADHANRSIKLGVSYFICNQNGKINGLM